MNIKSLDRNTAAKIWGDGTNLPNKASDLTEDEKGIRKSCGIVLQKLDEYSEYDLDWRFACDVYFDILPLKSGFTIRQASNDDIWRRLSIAVIPDFTARRWPIKNGRFQADHFWIKPQRIWLKCLWWYAHLCCQSADRNATEKCMQRGNTDVIQNIVERPGPGGFRVDLCREIMKRLGDDSLRSKDLRRVLKFNTSTILLVEPELWENGVPGYVDYLIQSINKGGQL